MKAYLYALLTSKKFGGLALQNAQRLKHTGSQVLKEVLKGANLPEVEQQVHCCNMMYLILKDTESIYTHTHTTDTILHPWYRLRQSHTIDSH